MIDALEESLATTPEHPRVPDWLWGLGGLWDRNLPGHLCATLQQPPALALKYDRYFSPDCCECWSRYNHKHWDQLVRRFPTHPMSDDAAYRLTQVAFGGECEGWVSCWIEREYGDLERFLRLYPTSDYAEEAVARANEAFASGLTFRPPYPSDLYEFDSTDVLSLVARYDTTAAGLPPRLRALAYRVIGPVWVALGRGARADSLYRALVSGLAEGADTGGLRQHWDSLVLAIRRQPPARQ